MNHEWFFVWEGGGISWDSGGQGKKPIFSLRKNEEIYFCNFKGQSLWDGAIKKYFLMIWWLRKDFINNDKDWIFNLRRENVGIGVSNKS